MTPPKGPVLFDIDDTHDPSVSPATAPPVPDPEGAALLSADKAAMQHLAQLAARPPSRLARWFWALAGSLVVFFAGVWATSAVASLLAAYPLLGAMAGGLLAAFVLVCGLVAAKEVMAFSRLGRLDRLQRDADRALADADLGAARQVARALAGLYAARPELRGAAAEVRARLDDMFDADAALGMAERSLLAPLDAAAAREVEAAARQVATVTALVPLALADVVAAATSNLRMIRRVAELYGGRAGTLGTWRLARAVLTHLVATGAVAVGDDLIGSVAGGSVLSKVSRRFGEGVVNGALTARVGVAAIAVCRPLPYVDLKRPSVSGLVKRALTGLFARSGAN